MLNTIDAANSNIQWLCNVSTPDLMNPFKSSHSAGNRAFHIGKVHLRAAKVPRGTCSSWMEQDWRSAEHRGKGGPHDAFCWPHSKEKGLGAIWGEEHSRRAGRHPQQHGARGSTPSQGYRQHTPQRVSPQRRRGGTQPEQTPSENTPFEELLQKGI